MTSASDIAEAWIAAEGTLPREKKWEQTPHDLLSQHAVWRMQKLPKKDPELAFAVICEVMERTGDDWLLELLGAGPIEDLINAHREPYLTKLNDLARQNLRARIAVESSWHDR